MRVRHFGLLANRFKKSLLPLCRKLLGLNPALPEVPNKSPHDLLLELSGIDLSRCPAAKSEPWSSWLNCPSPAYGTPHEKRTAF